MESNGIRSNVFRYAGVVFKLAFVQRRIECTLQIKPRRTASGVATIAVRTTCIFPKYECETQTKSLPLVQH